MQPGLNATMAPAQLLEVEAVSVSLTVPVARPVLSSPTYPWVPSLKRCVQPVPAVKVVIGVTEVAKPVMARSPVTVVAPLVATVAVVPLPLLRVPVWSTGELKAAPRHSLSSPATVLVPARRGERRGR